MADFEVKIDLSNVDRILKETEQAQKLQLKVGIDESRTYDNGTPVSDVATYLEYGWTQTATWKQRSWILAHSGVDIKRGTLSMPPRPIFRFTAQTCKGKWQKAGSRLLKNFTLNPFAVVFRCYQILGQMAVDDLKITVNTNGKGTFEPRSDLTLLIYGEDLEKHQPKGDSEKLRKRNISKKNTSNTRKALVHSTKLLNSFAFEILDGEE